MLAAGLALAPLGAPVFAQDGGGAVSQIVTIDRQSLFSDTQYGRRVVETVESERVRLANETRMVEAELVEEERQLTERRDTMTPEDFRELAKAFDAKVQALRSEGAAREQEFVQTLEREQAAFFERIGPILGKLVRELGAVVILDRRAILLTTQNIDITRKAVDRIDQVLGDGSDLPDAAPSSNQDSDQGDQPAVPTPPADAPALQSIVPDTDAPASAN
ncbi:OmpH family outer membrane protein [Aliiroseovarius sp. N1F302]|uniref:OmpH family outer membrane protein n=1 Tax=Aliiroseovarius sediminis TaxID=2925839 RepID=UPI001F561124|nr:OmpH family outer membrane protein [Aliiroseovarius sediminis]MCI2393712.1 OmpH family outer membrane protein [Aliiroseovarius sediminis]